MALTMRTPSLTTLRREERETYKECCAVFNTMQRLDKSGCSDEAYLEISALYRAVSDAHFAAIEALRVRHVSPDPEVPEPTPPAAPGAASVIVFPVRLVIPAIAA